MPAVEYVLFDLDGLLIDSERIYTEVTNEILSRYGKEMTIDIKAELMGKPERPSAEHLLSFFPDIKLTVDDYLKERRIKQELKWPTTQPLPGAIKLINHLKQNNIPIAIATGSHRRNMALKTSHLPELLNPFEGRIICADDVKQGKPCPDVFLAAAKLLGRTVEDGDYPNVDETSRSEREKGLVFEDAILGVQAGLRAGMQVVWVPDIRLRALEDGKALKPQKILMSLEEFQPEEWGLPPYVN